MRVEPSNSKAEKDNICLHLQEKTMEIVENFVKQLVPEIILASEFCLVLSSEQMLASAIKRSPATIFKVSARLLNKHTVSWAFKVTATEKKKKYSSE